MERATLRPSHERETKILFEAENHKYVVEGDENYISVTTIIHKFFPPFNKESVIDGITKRKTVKYSGLTRKEIAESWIKAADFGTEIHDGIESWLKRGIEPCYEGKYKICWDQFTNFWNDMTKERKIKNVASEIRIYDEEYKIAGSIDFFVEFEDGVCELYDWKCTPKLRRDGYERGYYPLEFPNSNYYHYLVQQNLYKYILEKHYGVKISKMFLVQFHHSLERYLKHSLQEIGEDIYEMLEIYKNKKISPFKSLLDDNQN